MHFSILPVLLLIFLQGCALFSAPTRDEEAPRRDFPSHIQQPQQREPRYSVPPTWAQNIPYGNEMYFYGLGTGPNPTEARNKAYADIVHQIVSNINSSYIQQSLVNNINGVEAFHETIFHKIRNDSEKVALRYATIENQAESAGTWYARMWIAKQAVYDEIKTKSRLQQAILEQHYERAMSSRGREQLLYLNRTINAATDLMAINGMLPEQYAIQEESILPELMLMREQVLANMTVYYTTYRLPDHMDDILASRLSEIGIRCKRRPYFSPSESPDIMFITLERSVLQHGPYWRDDKRYYLQEEVLNVEIKDGEGKIVSSNSHKVRSHNRYFQEDIYKQIEEIINQIQLSDFF